jgi:pimeloyl-ACP methyl ester carboxylesterase
VLCIPAAPGSGRYFGPLLASLGADRSVYAVDVPGCGESDPPPAGAGPLQLAAALKDFLDNMRIRRVDLLACGQGAAIAVAMAQQYPANVGHVALSPDDDAVRQLAHEVSRPVRLFGPAAAGLQIAADAGLAPALRDFFGGP